MVKGWTRDGSGMIQEWLEDFLGMFLNIFIGEWNGWFKDCSIISCGFFIDDLYELRNVSE